MASGSTGNYSIPYPVSTDPVNITGDMEALATRIDNILQEEIEDTAAGMWTSGGTFTNGLLAPTYNDSTGKMSMSLSQDLQTSASPTFAALNVTGNIFPVSDNTGLVGDASKTWSNGQFTNLTIDGTLSVRTAIDLADSDILQFGTSDDAKIFYDGSANILDIELESSAVSLNITDNGTDKVVITRSNGNISTVGQLISTIATGTAPISVSSSTVVANLNADLLDGQHGSYYAPISSPALSGTPTAPTAALNTNTTQIATTAFVVGQGYIKQNQTITLSGDATGSGTTAITVTVADDSHNHSDSTITSLNASKISAGTLGIARGGTGVSSTPTNGQILIGNGTGFSLATLTAGSNISITNSAGSITINSNTVTPETVGLESVLMFAGM